MAVKLLPIAKRNCISAQLLMNNLSSNQKIKNQRHQKIAENLFIFFFLYEKNLQKFGDETSKNVFVLFLTDYCYIY